jgi:hypothetical protein
MSGSAVTITVASRFSMKNAPATSNAIRREREADSGAAVEVVKVVSLTGFKATATFSYRLFNR